MNGIVFLYVGNFYVRDIQIILLTNYFVFYYCRELLTYTEGNIPLAETDWDKITKSKSLNIIGGEDSRNGNKKENSFQCMEQSESFEHNVNLSTDNNEPNGVTEIGLPQVEPQFESGAPEAQRALKLSFTLPASCYATMAIRELLKTSTSVCTKIKNESSHLSIH